MEEAEARAIAVVGVSAILPDAPDARTFFENLKNGRYSIGEVPRERWDPDLYWDPDPAVPDKTYSKIGGWVKSFEWSPLQWKLPIPPRVADAMDEAQKWAVACARSVLADYDYPGRPLDLERTAVVLGTAMAGDKHYLTSLRVFFPEYARALAEAPAFASLPSEARATISAQLGDRLRERLPGISEDTMPGELANCMAGRIANLFDFHGPNFVCDAACASALAALDAAVEGLFEHEFDAAVVGGVDRNMGPAPFVKFSKIGALSATGTRPYAAGADGFVMGEGAAFFLLKRLGDAERAGDRIYAVLRGVAGSSDGRGRGITAPNPAGQRLAIERAWRAAGLAPETASFVEGHGTSTRVGDVVEVETLNSVFGGHGLRPGSIGLGSVKSNVGHLKGAAGAAGLLKTVLALHEKVLPPSLNFDAPNPAIDFARSPFRVHTALEPWEVRSGEVRRAGVSAFGFGGTNYHAVLEEYVPGRLTKRRPQVAVAEFRSEALPVAQAKAPPRGALVLGDATPAGLRSRLDAALAAARAGRAPTPAAPDEATLHASERLAIDFADPAELAARAERARRALDGDDPGAWRLLRAQGVFRGRGAAPRTAFLFTGQGSQYANMLRRLQEQEAVVAETFREADRVMAPLLGRPLSEHLFADPDDPAALERAEQGLRSTEVTQPAVLTVDTALLRLLAAYGMVPDFVMGHSLGEYAALVAAGALPFADALEAVSARGREMAHLRVADPGRMAAVFAPLDQIRRTVETVGGYVVIANVNSRGQAVIGGASDAVERAVTAFRAEGVNAVPLPVSHAFHTRIVAPASEPLRAMLGRLRLAPPAVPIVSNVTGDFYPAGPDAVPKMVDLLGQQVASPVQFVKGLETLYAAGARVFVEVGPKKALHGFAEDVLGSREGVVALATNHPKQGEEASFNQALCGLWAAGLGVGGGPARRPVALRSEETSRPSAAAVRCGVEVAAPPVAGAADRFAELGRLVTEFLERGARLLASDAASVDAEPPVVTGAALGLPGAKQVFDDGHVQRILDGEQGIDVIPSRFRHAMVEKHVTRLVKEGGGGPHFEGIDSPSEVIKLAGRAGEFDLGAEYGVPAERLPALDVVTRLAIAAGLDALRDAGIPLVMHYRSTSKGTRLPERWMLPEPLRDETGVIFASAFPGLDAFAEEISRFHEDRARQQRRELLAALRERCADGPDGLLREEIERRLHELDQESAANPYAFDRRFLFRVLSMGHSQFAEYVGARGPNTQVNAACASTTQAFAIAEDWIRSGRCRRVVILGADDVTTERLLEWIGAGFLASGAAATDDVVEEAALPFDRRRHGMILGMGAVACVVEHPACPRERGLRPICEVLGAVTANSAFHGTRLDEQHIAAVMERLVADAERRFGLQRSRLARELLFVSHETYTPARGGSASAEVNALRSVFGSEAERIVIANTKGLTGHPMGAGIEDVVAIKALETGVVPPVPNYREPDPELGPLNLSKGGVHPIRYALRLGAGFGSQISLSLLRWVPAQDGRRPAPDALGYASRLADRTGFAAWLARMSGVADPELEVVKRTLRVRDARKAGSADAAAPRPEEAAAPALASRPAGPPREEARPRAPEPSRPAAPAEERAPAGDAAPGEAEDDAAIRERVLAIVAEKTGYPPDMLDLELDLEADLGIDTVKQAETFAAIREAWAIPRDEKLRLRDYPTLAHAIAFVKERMPRALGVPAAGSPAAEDDAAIRERVLAIVAEKTGYPPDMLDLELDLEADLGIDTVKQAETFAAIREAWAIPRDEKLRLRDYPTLAHAIAFVKERMPRAEGAARGTTQAPLVVEPGAAQPEAAAPGAIAGDLEAAARLARRVPAAVLRPPLERCKPTGVELGAGQRVAVMPDRGGVAQALLRGLEARGVRAVVLDPDADPAALAARLEEGRRDAPLHGLFWLPALDVAEDPAEMDLARWRAALALRVKLLHVATRGLYEALAAPGGFLVSATRLGGHHGQGPEGALDPLGGAVTGFTKTVKRERPEALVKAVDFPAGLEAAEIAGALIAETLRDPGVVEVGLREGRRTTVALLEEPLPAGEGLVLGPETVYLVTGAAGGIVSAIVADLARRGGGGVFHLLDRVPAPAAGDPDVRLFASDRDALRRALFERLRERGERGTPAQVEREIGCVERAHAATLALGAVAAAGGRARWHELDLTDAGAVAKAIDEVRQESGRVDVLLHAAGVERSRSLPDKEPEEFDLVFDVKADGWFNLMRAAGELPLRATVAFSSIAGRFGNAGQADYAAANDLLCKCASALRRTRPGLRALAIDWTAWGEVGMATRGSIPQLMERAGIDLLPAAAGIPVVGRELRAGASGEVLIAGRLGVLEQEWDATGGLDAAAFGSVTPGPLAGRVTGMGLREGLCVETLLEPARQPFLDHHRIDGTPVLPGVMGLEAFAEAALRLLPGWTVRGFEEVRFEAPFKFYRDAPRSVEVLAQLRPDGEEVLAECRLLGQRELPGGGTPQRTRHFSARVRLAPVPLAGERGEPPPARSDAGVSADEIYRIYFHGPAYRVLERAWRAGDAVAGRLADGLPANHAPAALPLQAAPRLVELCFQTAGVHEIVASGRMGLPRRIAHLEFRGGVPTEAAGVVARVTPRADGGYDAVVVDASGSVLLRLSGYETSPLPEPLPDELREPLRRALAAT
jgi:acyl transferase domain-containing protein